MIWRKIMKIVMVVMVVMLSVHLYAQDCAFYSDYEEGTEVEYTTYDRRDREQGKHIHRVEAVEEEGNKKTWTIQTRHLDTDDNETMDHTFELECINGTFHIDMSELVRGAETGTEGQYEMVIEGAPILLPSELQVGKRLEDGEMQVKMLNPSSKQEMANMNITIKDRRVEAEEVINTPAGEFRTYKISATMTSTTTAMGMKVATTTINTIEYFSEEYGAVRTETHRNGKLQDYTQITAINGPSVRN